VAGSGENGKKDGKDGKGNKENVFLTIARVII
jgi:hypothetical protein